MKRRALFLLGSLAMAGHVEAVVAQQASPPGPVERQQAHFPIRDIHLAGATLVPLAALTAAVKPYLGENRTLEDLLAARQAIQQVYDRAGYKMVSVGLPEQIGMDGQITLTIREIPVGRVQVSGNHYFSGPAIRAALPALQEGHPIDFSALNRQLFLANDNSAHYLNVQFAEGQGGAADANILVKEQKPLKYGLTLDNTGNRATGISRLGVLANDNNLFGLGHTATFSYTTSPEHLDKVKQAALFYQAPLSGPGDKLNLSASYSNVNSGQIANAFTVAGAGTTFGMHYVHTLYRSSAAQHSLDFGLDDQRFKNTLDFAGTNLGVDINALPASVGYQMTGNLPGGGQLSESISYLHNLPGGALNNDATYNASRSGARANWQALRLNASYTQPLPKNWQGVLRLEQQYTNAPLISGEQIGLGGIHSVRGLEERELSGDRGTRYNVEIYTPPVAQVHRFLGFIDGGNLQRLDALPGESASFSVLTYGLGWRWTPAPGAAISLDWARVQKGTQTHPQGDQMLHVAAGWWF